jgi:hypothetical protein
MTPHLTQARIPLTLRDHQPSQGLNGAPSHATRARSFVRPRRMSGRPAVSRRSGESHRSAHRRVARTKRVREVNGYALRALALPAATTPPSTSALQRAVWVVTSRTGRAVGPRVCRTSAGGSSPIVSGCCERLTRWCCAWGEAGAVQGSLVQVRACRRAPY